MNKRWLAAVAAVFTAMTTLLFLLGLVGRAGHGFSRPALAFSTEAAALTVTAVDPTSAPNDIDTPIVIAGTGFLPELTGTLTMPPPMAYLGAAELDDVTWVNSTTLTAAVPWGLAPGVYTLTVVNPDGGTASLTNAFTVTPGFGVWATGGPYGGDIAGVVLNPVTPTTVYALAENAAIFASYDGAANWQPILLGSAPGPLVIDAGDSEVMYFDSGQRLLRTNDGGSTWESISPPETHNPFYPTAHPTTPGVVYVGTSAQPSLFRSEDYGDTWVTLTVGPPAALVKTIAFHPDDPDRMLAGTQDGDVFLSTDGGKIWDWRAKVSSHVERLYFNPFGAHEAWATTDELVYGSLYPDHYLYKSEDPELRTWTPIDVAGGKGVRSLTFLSDTIWSAGAEGYTSTDGGASWSPLSRAGLQPGWMENTREFAIDPSNPDVIYAGDLGHGLFKSSDGGATWSMMNEGLAAVVPLDLAVTPTDPDTVYADTYALGVIKSSNGGHSWRSLGVGGIGFGHPLAVDPVTPTRVYLGVGATGYLRIQISEDAGDTWREVTATLPVTWSGWETDILIVAPHPHIPGRILAGAQFLLSYALSDSGTERGAIYASDDYGEDWEYVGPTQPISGVFEIAYDAADPNLAYAGTHGTGLWKSADGGASWLRVTSFPGDEIMNEIGSVVAHPDVPNTVYARCEDRLHQGMASYVSRDAGETWEELPPCEECGQLLFVPAERGKPPYTLYAGPGSPYGLFRSTDEGYTWEQVEDVPATAIYSLAAGSDGERSVLYVGISGGVVTAESQTAAAADVMPGQDEIRPGGVYRLTTRLPSHWVYLPLVLRTYAP